MSSVSVEELKKRLIIRMLTVQHLKRILTDTTLIVEYAKAFYNNTNYMGLYYVVLNIRDEIEKLESEIKELKERIMVEETEKKINKALKESE
jgi:cell division protein FtsB